MAEPTYDPDDPFAQFVPQDEADPFGEFAPVDDQPPVQFPTEPPMEEGTSRAAIQLPELGSGMGYRHMFPEDTPWWQQAGVTAAAMTMTDPQEIATMLQQFPNVGITQAADGTLIATNNETGAQAVINRPGLSATDILQTLGIGAAFFPSGRLTQLAGAGSREAAKAAASETIKKEMLKQATRRSAAVGAGTGAATQTGIEAGQALAGGTFDEGDIGLAGAFGAIPEYVAQPLVRAGSQLKTMAMEGLEALPQNIRQALEYAKATGREITTSDAMEEYLTPAMNVFYRMTERIPITGTGKQRIRQRAQRADSLMELAQDYGLDVDSELGQEIVESFVQRMKNRRFFGANKNPTDEMVQRAFGREADEITDSILQRYIRRGQIDETLADTVFDKGSRTAIDEFFNKLNDTGKEAARQRFLARGLDEAGWRPEAPQVGDPNKLMQFLDKKQSRAAIDSMFTDAEKDTLEGMREYLRLTLPAQKAGEGAGMTAAVGGGLGAVFRLMSALVGPGAIMGGAGRTAQSGAARNLLLKLKHAKGNEKEVEAIMNQLRPLVQGMAQTGFGEDVENLPFMGPSIEITQDMVEQQGQSAMEELRRRSQDWYSTAVEAPGRLMEMLID